MTTISHGSTAWTATLDHRTGATLAGGPASRYQRVARCDDRHTGRPNYAARRLGALFAALSIVMGGVWFTGVVAAGFAARPASAAAIGADASRAEVHVARSGDTLWSIADEYRGAVEHHEFVDALVTLNAGTSIQIGQAVRLP